ncbi:MAG: hypothetical protein NTY96_06065 [Bacteroidetes bacterium]|nr:hypothetical protein [Bacteroidota bacterium]
MKIKKMLLLILFVIPALTFAGDIFGTITKNGRPFAKQLVKITTNDGTVIKSDSTDAFGYFTMNIKQLGQFKLSAGGAVADVTSNNSPTGYTFILVQNNSKWQLIKK